MNEKLANIIKERISGLNFVDKISGMVRSVIINEKDNEDKIIKKIFPISCDITIDECESGKYKDLIPDGKYKSVIYFEDVGTSMRYAEKRKVYFTSRLNIVCWLNIKKLQSCNIYVISPEVILMILTQFPEFPISDDIYREIRFTAIRELPKNSSIFNKYTYDESISQYLLYPYDYFSLEITLDYFVDLNCVNNLILSECTC